MWWNLNKWEYLHINEILRRRANISRNGDQDLGGVRGADDTVPGGVLKREVVQRDVLPVLKQALKDRYHLNRQAAIIALGKTGDASALAPLLETIKDQSQVVQESAILSLGLLGQPQAVNYLVEIMQDSMQGRRLVEDGKVSRRTRMYAAFALGLIGDGRALSPLLELAHDSAAKDKELATFAVAAVGALGSHSAVPDLCRLVSDTKLDKRIRATACVSLSKIGDRGPIVLRVLSKALDDKQAAVVQGASTALGALARPEDTTIVKALAEVADKHGDVLTRALGLMALSRVGGLQAYELTTGFLKKRGLIGGYAPMAVALAAKKADRSAHARSLLRRHVKRAKDPEIRRSCYVAFGLLGAKRQGDQLMRVAVSKKSPEERATAVSALGMIGDPQCANLLRDLVSVDNHGAIRGEAALSLGLVGKRSEAATTLTNVLATADNNFIRAGAALALGLLGNSESVPGLEDLANGASVNGDTRAFASGALGLLSEPDDLPVLYRYRANNLFYFDLPVMRQILLLL
ncbi:MAG: hypothetical protein CMJ83_19765 [Planctomycetes bacterium]|nr:hypothetical protein [Planctomycetota bacterium]